MNCKVFTQEQWTRISELVDYITTLWRIERTEAETHAQRNAVNATRRMLFEKLDRELASGEWRNLMGTDVDSDLPF